MGMPSKIYIKKFKDVYVTIIKWEDGNFYWFAPGLYYQARADYKYLKNNYNLYDWWRLIESSKGGFMDIILLIDKSLMIK